MKKYILFFVVSTVCISFAKATIPTQVKKSVAFIFTKDAAGTTIPRGTGFFLLMSASQNGDTANFGYLATTKQMLQRSSGNFYDTMYVRINRKDGVSDTMTIPLNQNAQRRFFLHPDSTVDLAVIPALPDGSRYDFLFIPVGMIAASDLFGKEKITEGDDLFYTGMYRSQIGSFKNIPVVRPAKVAQLSDEKYLTANGYSEMYLVETSAAKEMNGSPLFYFAPAVNDTGNAARQEKFLLAGIISGAGESGNTLVTAVPAFRLSELLNSSAAAGEREKEFQRLREAKKK